MVIKVLELVHQGVGSEMTRLESKSNIVGVVPEVTFLEIGGYRYQLQKDGSLKTLLTPMVDEEVKPEIFINESGLEFKDISSEEFREYTFTNGNTVRIEQPIKLNVSPSGGHRIFTALGMSYYVQPVQGWFLKWRAKDGEPNFVK